MKTYDITLLTDARYVLPQPGNWYVENIHQDDAILRAALERRGLKVHRTHWDNPDFDWSQTRFVLFRTPWDCFERFEEFSEWLKAADRQTQFINDADLIRWNWDKHYLGDLAAKGINIPPTVFVEIGETRTLQQIAATTDWTEFVLKPAISSTARHTYRFDPTNLHEFESIFQQLIGSEAMLLQEFQGNVSLKGEITLMMMAGQFTHAVLKKPKEGDFRVQDDFGGTVVDFTPSKEEIKFAESVLQACPYPPLYARVDAIWDNQDLLCVSELEAFEPELWFRKNPQAAEVLADAIAVQLSNP
jgi:glutathione synthase/RimK-type ligase-like ATP-grasp enzyme